jgi:AAA family ATP:ADP antiporter
LPVPVNVKLQVKSFIDTVIWRLGDGLAGVAVLISATYLHLTAREVSWVNMVLIIGWLSAAYVARRQYVSVLRESIQQHRLDAERASAPVLDRSTTNILVDSLNATDPKDILYALNLFAMAHRRATHPAVRGLLDHPAAEVRQRAVTILDSAGDKAVMPKVEKLLYDEDLGVRTDALLYLTHQARIDPLRRIEQLGDFPDFSIRSAMVAFLAQPGDAQNLEAAGLLLDAMVKETGPDGQRTRLEAARLIGQLPDHFGEQLRELLRDEDADVARRAVRAVGRLRKRRFILRLIEMLGIAELAPDVVEALARFGNRVVGTLRDVLSDPEMSLEVRREIPAVLLRIGTQEAEGVLVENLLQGDTTLRFKIISALNKLHQAHPELTLDAQMIEMVLAAEIMGHYRSYQILGMLGEELESQDPAVCALRDSMNHEVERIFRLLGLQFPNHDLYSVYVGLQSNNPTVHANALEFLDNIFKPQLRSLLVPLLDGEVSVAERVRLANRLVSVKVESREEAVQALMYSEDPWLKSCAAYAVGALGLKSLGPDLDKWADDPDPLLCETVRQAKLRLAKVPEATASRHRG